MQLLINILAFWAVGFVTAGPVSRDCTIAIECSNGNTYVGCDAVKQCEAAGGHLVPIPEKRETAPQLTCALIVYCSDGKIYKGCDAVQACAKAGGVSCGGAPCATSKCR